MYEGLEAVHYSGGIHARTPDLDNETELKANVLVKHGHTGSLQMQ